MKVAYISNMYSTCSRNNFILRLLGKVPVRAMKAYKGSWGITPLIHVGRSWTINITPWPLNPRETNIGILLRMRLGGPHRRSVTCRKEKNLFFPCRDTDPGPSWPWLVTFFSVDIGVLARAWSWSSPYYAEVEHGWCFCPYISLWIGLGQFHIYTF